MARSIAIFRGPTWRRHAANALLRHRAARVRPRARCHAHRHDDRGRRVRLAPPGHPRLERLRRRSRHDRLRDRFRSADDHPAVGTPDRHRSRRDRRNHAAGLRGNAHRRARRRGSRGYGSRDFGRRQHGPIAGNFIGTDVTCTADLGNTGFGIYLCCGSDDVLVGGTSGTTPGGPCTGACNLISGNLGGGVNIWGAPGNARVLVQGNFIGVDVTGTTAPIPATATRAAPTTFRTGRC